MKNTLQGRVRLGSIEVDLRAGTLREADRSVILQEQPLRILRMLMEADGQLVAREEIRRKLWPNDTVVEFDQSINAAIKKLRLALGDSPDTPKYIETLPRRGYRLLVPGEWLRADSGQVSGVIDDTAVRSQPEPGLIGKKVSHYRVLEILGGGGMGMVYMAEDMKLPRKVALKFLPEELARDTLALQRFQREAEAASALDHPNICTIYEVEEYEGQPFIVMQLLQGETLRDRLAALAAKQETVPLQELLDIAIQICDGLRAAHAKGIIHRDIKPANIFLTSSGQVKILDFSLAKLVGTVEEEQSDGLHVEGTNIAYVPQLVRPEPVDATLTRFGVAMGTAGYMSPEQFRGEELDARTDIFSFGLVLYEMATGQRAFTGETATAVHDAILNQTLTPVRNLNPTQPVKLVTTIDKCVQMERGQRYQSVAELASALQDFRNDRSRAGHGWWLWLAGSLLVLTAVLLGTRLHPRPQQRHIAILPFQNIGNDPSNQAFADGVTETLTSKLSQLERYQQSLWVVPSSDTRNIKSLDEAYRNLNVTLAITGSIEHTADGLNLTTDLVDPRNHRQLASRSIHVSSLTLDEMQERVWESVADMLDLQVSQRMKEELAAGRTSQPYAYELYERGVGYLSVGELESTNHAIDLFREALIRDPHYALAYAGLGEAYARKYYLTKDPKWIAEATGNAGRAADLNDRLVPVRFTLARVYEQTGQLDKALAEYQRVLEQDPSAIEAQYKVGEIYRAQGKYADAESADKSVIAQRPTYWDGYAELGHLYYEQGQFEKAAQQFQAVIDVAPNNTLGYQDLGGTYIALGRYQDAIKVLKQGLDIAPNADVCANLGAAYVCLGQYEEAAEAMKKATELAPHDHVTWRNLGDVYEQIPSRQADARSAYEKALETATVQLKVNPNDPEVLSGIALYRAHLGQSKEAENFIVRALKVSPNNSDTLFTSALVYEILGHRDEALKTLDRAVTAGYSLDVVEKEPELRSLRADPHYQRWLRQRKVVTGSAE